MILVNSVKLLVFFAIFKILLVSTQDDNLTFLVTDGYRPREHTLAKHIVSIRHKEYGNFFGCLHFCEGSILSSRTILTAAHCLWDSKLGQKLDHRELYIVAGTPNRLKRTKHTEVIKVEQTFLHQGFDEEKVGNDIGILRLETDIAEDGVYAQRIRLPDGPPKENQKCTVLGWGSIFELGPIAADALYIDIYILARDICKVVFKNFPNGLLCAANLSDPLKDACQGDSGGPLISDGKITGVVSFGIGCGEKPGFYTDVWLYRDWIRANGQSRTTIKLMNVLLLALLMWIFIKKMNKFN